MGLDCSWIAVKGAPIEALLRMAGLAERDEYFEVDPGTRAAPFSYLVKPDGWTVLASEDSGWADRKRILLLSSLGHVVGCQFGDTGDPESIATGAAGGLELWRVSYTAGSDSEDLLVLGTPPEEFATIRNRLSQKQSPANRDEEGDDDLYELPLELAKAACGYRLDEWETTFIALDVARKSKAKARPRRTIWTWLFEPLPLPKKK